MPEPHIPSHIQSSGIRVVKCGAGAAQCITPYINHRRVYFVMIDGRSKFINQRSTVLCFKPPTLYIHTVVRNLFRDRLSNEIRTIDNERTD